MIIIKPCVNKLHIAAHSLLSILVVVWLVPGVSQTEYFTTLMKFHLSFLLFSPSDVEDAFRLVISCYCKSVDF